MKPIILAVNEHYEPAKKAGGAHLALRHLTDWLHDDFDFYILTTDHDLGDFIPYPDIQHGTWYSVGKAQVRYLSHQERTPLALAQIINSIPHDVLYLNSVFASLSVKIITAKRLNRIHHKPTLITPMGEFYPGAIGQKHLKKQVYLILSRITKMYQSALWHATTTEEAQQIQKHRQVPSKRVHIAPLLPPRVQQLPTPSPKKADELKMVFLSRISPKKNLDGALRLLMDVKHPVKFDIYGPIEDSAYWQICQDVMKQLPVHIQARYCGAITQGQIELFSQYHLFLFPTHGENFAYVIQESLLGGCLPLISTNTPWRGLADKKAGWDVSLENPDEFIQIMKRVYGMDDNTFRQWSQSAQDYGLAVANDSVRIQASRDLFHFALKGTS